jgi:hypothetical protein
MRYAALRRLGLRKTAVGLRLLCGFSPPHFFAPVKMLRIFPYRAQKNVAYSWNVRRKFFETWIKNNLTKYKNYY